MNLREQPPRTPEEPSLVGFGAIGQSEWRWTGKKDPYLPVTMITWFGVHEDYQGQPPLPKEDRYSRKIFEDLISEALEDQETHPVLGLVVRAENTRAIHLYREFGFTDHGLQPFTDKQTNTAASGELILTVPDFSSNVAVRVDLATAGTR